MQLSRIFFRGIVLAVFLAVVGLAAMRVRATIGGRTEHSDAGLQNRGILLVAGKNDTVEVSPEVKRTLGLRTEKVVGAQEGAELTLWGSLFIDPSRMVRVHSRFAGEVVSIGPFGGEPGAEADTKGPRPLRMGDHVRKGQLLAIVWSKDLGEKKSDLVNALSELFLHKSQLDRLMALESGVVPKKAVFEASHEYESDLIEVQRYERTLRSWNLDEQEIAEIRAEADAIHRNAKDSSGLTAKTWAEVDIVSPMDGVILEKNITAGDMVDTSLDLFKVANLSVLGVSANLYEENIAAVENLTPEQSRWRLFIAGQPEVGAIPGGFDTIGQIIDPAQHTAAIMGWVNNDRGVLRAGQFVSAVINLPPSPDEVQLPRDALIDDGTRSVVFMAADEEASHVSRRQIAVTRRGDHSVFARRAPTEAEQTDGCRALESGEHVVVSGSVELAAALEGLLAERQRNGP